MTPSPPGCVQRQHFKGFVSTAERTECIMKNKLSKLPHVHADIFPSPGSRRALFTLAVERRCSDGACHACIFLPQ